MIRAGLILLCVVLATIVAGYAFRDLFPSVGIVFEFLAGALAVLLAVIELLAFRREHLAALIAMLSGLTTLVLGGVLLHEISESTLTPSQALLATPAWLRWGALSACLLLLLAAGRHFAAARSERRMKARIGRWPREYPE